VCVLLHTLVENGDTALPNWNSLHVLWSMLQVSAVKSRDMIRLAGSRGEDFRAGRDAITSSIRH
jgi:hypothetical protein